MSAVDSYALLVKSLPVLNAGALTALIAMVLRHRILSRKVAIDEESNRRKLQLDEETHDVESWGKLIKTLTEQVERLSGQVTELQTENGLLRGEIRQLHNVIDGMRRSGLADALSNQVVVARALNPSPEVSAALDTIEGLSDIRKRG
jgi:predicted RNase H-like nuclease (RuvC/YqgF family)